MSRESILVVDDEADILELVRYNLSKDGFQVECQGSGEDGLSAIEKARYDLVLLDLMLPGINGLEVCKTLRRDNKTQDLPNDLLQNLCIKGKA